MFSQILKLIPRIEFEHIVKRTQAEYASKGFSSWGQLVARLFCQLGRAHSLREIEGGLKSCEGKLAHLGIEAPARSLLSYANAHRPWQLFEQVFHGLYDKVAAKATGKHKFRFKNKLVRPANLHIGLLDAPRSTGLAGKSIPTLLELRHETLNPSHDRHVSQVQPAFGHHLNQVAKAQREAQVPANA
jgi:hypothetical protein